MAGFGLHLQIPGDEGCGSPDGATGSRLPCPYCKSYTCGELTRVTKKNLSGEAYSADVFVCQTTGKEIKPADAVRFAQGLGYRSIF